MKKFLIPFFILGSFLAHAMNKNSCPIQQVDMQDSRIARLFSPRGDSLFAGPAFSHRGLIWSGSSLEVKTFKGAKKFCESVQGRLPNPDEFLLFHESALDYEVNDIFYHGMFWTSNIEKVLDPKDNSVVEIMADVLNDNKRGYISSIPLSAKAYVRCVIESPEEVSTDRPSTNWRTESHRNLSFSSQGGRATKKNKPSLSPKALEGANNGSRFRPLAYEDFWL